MKKIAILSLIVFMMTACYGESDSVYSKNFENHYSSEIFEVDAIYNNIVRVISKNGNEKNIELSKEFQNIKEGDTIIIKNSGKVVKKEDNSLKSEVENLQKQLQKENQMVAINTL